jgi:hypothetical protein
MQNIELIAGAGVLLILVIIIAIVLKKKEHYKSVDFSITHGNEGAGVTNVGNVIEYEHLVQIPTGVSYDAVLPNMLQLPEPTFPSDFYDHNVSGLTNASRSMYTSPKEKLTDFVSETKRCGA